MSLVKDIELPSPEVMVQRAMAVTGATDEYQVSQMVRVVNDMADTAEKTVSLMGPAVCEASLIGSSARKFPEIPILPQCIQSSVKRRQMRKIERL